MSEATPSGESGLPGDEEEWRYFSGADRSGEFAVVREARRRDAAYGDHLPDGWVAQRDRRALLAVLDSLSDGGRACP